MKMSKAHRKLLWTVIIAIIAVLAALAIWYLQKPKFDPEQVYQTYHEINQAAEELEQHSHSETETINEEQLPALLEQVGKIAQQYQEKGQVVQYKVEDTCVYMELEGGIGYVYTPTVADMMSGDGGVSSGKHFDRLPNLDAMRNHILTIEPYVTDPKMLAHYLMGGRSPDKAARAIVDALPDYFTFAEAYNWDSFTYDSAEKMGSYPIIIWYGHGTYTEEYGPLLGSSIPSDDLSSLVAYDQGLYEGEMVLGKDNFLLTPRYFEHHLEDGSLQGSLVYLAACESARDDRLGNVFVDKGAELVVGNTRSIFTRYNLYMMTDFLIALTKQYEDGTYWTAEDALAYAKEENGERDSLFYGAQVVLGYAPGKSEYRLVPLKEETEKAEGNTLPTDASPARRYLEQTILPRYVGQPEELTLTYQQLYDEETGGSMCFHQAEKEHIAYLDSHIEDYNQDGIEDLLVVSLNLRRDEPHLRYLKGHPDMGLLSCDIDIYCFNEEGAVKNQSSNHMGIYAYKQETISISTVNGKVIWADARDDDSMSSTQERDFNDLHEDQIQMMYWGENAQGYQAMLASNLYRKIRYLSLQEAEAVIYERQDSIGQAREEFFFSGADGITYTKPDGTKYDPPLIHRETRGQVETEEEACALFNAKMQEVTGVEAFSLSPYSWDTRWENNFLPGEDSDLPQIILEVQSTNTFDHGETGQTTIRIKNLMN